MAKKKETESENPLLQVNPFEFRKLNYLLGCITGLTLLPFKGIGEATLLGEHYVGNGIQLYDEEKETVDTVFYAHATYLLMIKSAVPGRGAACKKRQYGRQGFSQDSVDEESSALAILLARNCGYDVSEILKRDQWENIAAVVDSVRKTRINLDSLMHVDPNRFFGELGDD